MLWTIYNADHIAICREYAESPEKALDAFAQYRSGYDTWRRMMQSAIFSRMFHGHYAN